MARLTEISEWKITQSANGIISWLQSPNQEMLKILKSALEQYGVADVAIDKVQGKAAWVIQCPNISLTQLETAIAQKAQPKLKLRDN